MRGSQRLVRVACFLVSALGVSAARAGSDGAIAGGTITFVGAIVEPTCSIASTPAVLDLAAGAIQRHAPLQRSCLGPASATSTVGVSRPYTVDVVHLSGSESDQVLRYFANYVRAARQGSADPVLVTQTYE